MKHLEETSQDVSPADIGTFFKYAGQQEVDILRAKGARCYMFDVEPESLLYIPMGFWVVERCLRLQSNFGIRCSFIPKAREKENQLLALLAPTPFVPSSPERRFF